MSKIPCSVGILTYNSGRNLRRALESVRDFSDIIISDGGSTDATLAIAKEFGCTIIDQYTKHHPGPDKYHPIEDFSRERNRMLEVAKEDWYLWIDSDEYISDILREEIIEITTSKDNEHYAYEIPIAVQSPDAAVTYRQWKQTYQIRFFNRRTGGKFEKVMHERFVFDKQKFSLSRLSGCWYVPLSKPDFTSYGRAVRYRLWVMMKNNPPKNIIQFLHQGVFVPIKRLLGLTYRVIMMRLFFSWKEVMPWYYLRNQCYSQWVTFTVVLKLYVEYKKKN